MNTLREKFHVYFQSSRKEDRRIELFEYIWAAYGRRISFYIGNIIPVSHPAFEDVFQEIMLKIYRNLPRFNPLRSFKAWIYVIARNHCLDFVNNREEKIFAGKARPGGDPPGDDDPERMVMAGEAMDRIDACLSALDALDRQIAFLRFFEDLSYREIAQITGMNPGTLRARIHHIKKDLAHSLRGFL